MSARDVLNSPGFGADYTVTRRAAGAYVVGDWTPGSTSTFTIRANIQPYRGKQVLTDASGRRRTGAIVIRTVTRLEPNPTAPDTISYDGQLWEVFMVDRWDAFGGTHYRNYAALQGTP